MAKVQLDWTGEIEGKPYHLHYKRPLLTVNGTPTRIKPGLASAFLGLDEEFAFDGHTARLVLVKGRKMDVAVNGVFLQQGTEYKERPTWAVIFAIISVISSIVAFGALGALLGMLIASLHVQIAKTSWPVAARIGLCVLITAVQWVLYGWLFILAATPS